MKKEKTNKEIDAAEAISYRTQLRVNSVIVYLDENACSICPRCDNTLEREYKSYCDRCGQKLSWKGFSNAKIITWAERHASKREN